MLHMKMDEKDLTIKDKYLSEQYNWQKLVIQNLQQDP